MTIFTNFKNQLQRFMTLGSLKSNGITFMTIFKNFINQGVTNHSKKKTLRYFGLRSSALASKTETTKWTNEESDEVKAQFPETKEFIEERLEQECNKENIPVEEVVFLFTCLEAKS